MSQVYIYRFINTVITNDINLTAAIPTVPISIEDYLKEHKVPDPQTLSEVWMCYTAPYDLLAGLLEK